MRVLITGGSGFIGSHAILQLLADGHAVRSTLRSLGREAELRALLGAVGDERLRFVAADLTAEAGWAEFQRIEGEGGLVVAGFPCNDFGGQEPASDKDIKKFCKTNFKVTFPMYAKVAIKGNAAHPLFEKLTGKDAGHPGPVGWNFNKFLIGADGKLIARFGSDVDPDSEELEKAIEKALK